MVNKRTKIVFAITSLLVITAALVIVTFFMNQNSNQELESGYWILNISTTPPGAGTVTPNGTIYVPLNQLGINVTAAPKGGNGFHFWILDGEELADRSSTIFVPKQALNSTHTLQANFILGHQIAPSFPSSSISH
ncbi:MAG: hypothetical protein A2W22_06775 [Candidatus Levybacteria bacterium RBG_16_35_11]|nr:MAG: hypothetical protein A2W22_06775 [Candidatus Levybacteria bacterium RBG_16_35_11]